MNIREREVYCLQTTNHFETQVYISWNKQALESVRRRPGIQKSTYIAPEACRGMRVIDIDKPKPVPPQKQTALLHDYEGAILRQQEKEGLYNI